MDDPVWNIGDQIGGAVEKGNVMYVLCRRSIEISPSQINSNLKIISFLIFRDLITDFMGLPIQKLKSNGLNQDLIYVQIHLGGKMNF